MNRPSLTKPKETNGEAQSSPDEVETRPKRQRKAPSRYGFD